MNIRPIYDEQTGLDVSAIPEEHRKHYLNWVCRYESDDHRIEVTRYVSLALSECPELIEEGRSWSEIRDIGERIQRQTY